MSSLTSQIVKISPMVILSILDHFTRRHVDQEYVIGTLLGTIAENGDIIVSNCFAIPYNVDAINDVEESHRTLLSLFRKVNKLEFVIGWYTTDTDIGSSHIQLQNFFSKECRHAGKDLQRPIVLTVDTSLKTNSIQSHVYTSSNIGVGDSPSHGLFFSSLAFEITTTSEDRPGLDLLLQASETGEATPSIEPVSDFHYLKRCLAALDNHLAVILDYVNAVCKGEIEGNPLIGRQISHVLSSIPQMPADELEEAFNTDLQDLLMVVYLSKLTRHQLSIARRLQNVISLGRDL
ncbi:hypothetical protein H696_04886 [Fonticula alba]|uniref:MPN domain-containing protein n=1 Tax=Fonticula alba TaxID=691883 RepID=A0A058Z2T8_FONAL|nr:hypothetical protein H696_04886 [Fonticula alba]KCV68594.1 hypothetical protein H696_04886 [Fonticula alba]|eukprot:XP_009497026.1 hypothetical protein H696_04886 [Fonticula alba]